MKTFKQSVEDFWQEFKKEEASLRPMMQQPETYGEALVERMDEMLNIVFHESYFEMGVSKTGKYELILTPNGDHLKHLFIHQWMMQAPKSLLDHWNFYDSKPVEEQADFGLKMNGYEVCGSDIMIYPSIQDQKMDLRVYSEKLNQMEEEQAYQFLFLLLDSHISELYTMKFIGSIELIEQPGEHGILLKEFKAFMDDVMKEEHWKNLEDPFAIYSAYEVPPKEEDICLREDVYFGITTQMHLLNTFYQGDPGLIEEAQKDGIFVGFVYYENSQIDTDEMLDYREYLDTEIMKQCKETGIAVNIGAATGIAYSYLDYVVFDLDAFLSVVKDVMHTANTQQYGFQRFVMEEQPILHIDKHTEVFDA